MTTLEQCRTAAALLVALGDPALPSHEDEDRAVLADIIRTLGEGRHSTGDLAGALVISREDTLGPLRMYRIEYADVRVRVGIEEVARGPRDYEA